MKTYPLQNEKGELHAFEIENIWVGREGATAIVERIPGVIVKRRPKKFLSDFREDVFCEFELNGVTFEIEEPFGDNSRYWIGKAGGGWCPEVEIVERAFREV
jgi:hypothetical protein